MENLFIELVKQINPAQIIIIGLIFFYFYSRLDDKIKETNKEIKETNKEIKETNKEIKETNKEIKALDNKFTSEIRSLDDKFDKKLDNLRAEIKEENKALSIRIDAINARLDSLYRELFRKDAA